MPVTPFHFGPALLIEYLLRRRIDLGTFLIASVITDVRAMLVFFGLLPEPLHGPFHQTYLGPSRSRSGWQDSCSWSPASGPRSLSL
jgi:hypothetical protein